MGVHHTVEKLLGSLVADPWGGVVYRVMLGDTPPDRENTLGARWNQPGIAAIYTSLQADTAIAEVEFNLSRQPRSVRPDLKKTLYEIDVRVGASVDLTTSLVALAELGIDRELLFSEDMRASQDIGRTITWFGHDSLLVPSARIEGVNLVIFPSRVDNGTYLFQVRESRVLTRV